MATGEPFIAALRALAGEYGIRMSSESYNPAAERWRAHAWRESLQRALYFKAGFLALIDEMLLEEMTCPSTGENREPKTPSLVRALTRCGMILREASSQRFLVGMFDAFRQVLPELADALAVAGEAVTWEGQSILLCAVYLMAAEVHRWAA
jgi:hypothetical protein